VSILPSAAKALQELFAIHWARLVILVTRQGHYTWISVLSLSCDL